VLAKELQPKPITDWNKVFVQVTEDTIKVMVNRKVIFDNFKDDSIQRSTGTMMFGINNIIAAFSDIKITATMPDE